MTSNFADFESDPLQPDVAIEDNSADCFELLSAYLDGELSLGEKQQVEIWLDRDPQIKALYTQLLGLQSQMQHSVAPPSEKSVAEITAEVFATIEVERRHAWQNKLVWASGAVAASLLAAFGLIPGVNPVGWRLAQTDSNTNADSVMLAVAVNKPAIDIPKGLEGYSDELRYFP